MVCVSNKRNFKMEWLNYIQNTYNKIPDHLIIATLLGILAWHVVNLIVLAGKSFFPNGGVLVRVLSIGGSGLFLAITIRYIANSYGLDLEVYSIFLILAVIIHLFVIGFSSYFNSRVAAAPFTAYVYIPLNLILWVAISNVSLNTAQNAIHIRSISTTAKTLHGFRRFPKWYLGFINGLILMGLRSCYPNDNYEEVLKTYMNLKIEYENSIGRTNSLVEAISKMVENEFFIDMDTKQEKNKPNDTQIEKMASEFSETGKSKTADELGYHLGVLDSSKKSKTNNDDDK